MQHLQSNSVVASKLPAFPNGAGISRLSQDVFESQSPFVLCKNSLLHNYVFCCTGIPPNERVIPFLTVDNTCRDH